jgi:folate-binding protein YgfZ
MTTDSPSGEARPSVVRVVGPHDISRAAAEALDHGAAMAVVDSAVLSVTGSGAVLCMQGMLTADIEGSGPRGFSYGAALTPKGMIVSDLWVARRNDGIQLFVPTDGKEPLLEIFRRSLPPRLARTEDRSESVRVFQVVGPESSGLVQDAGIDLPEIGESATAECGGYPCDIARPGFEQPFGIQISSELDGAETVLAALEHAGVVRADPPILDAARVIAGWPRLGAEIDSKTLPQEVRFDDIGGLSYTKGCYTGQETVARVHFRGHANRRLVGLVWDANPSSDDGEIRDNGKSIGRVGSIVWLPDPKQVVGLAVIRREVGEDAVVTAAGAPARISTLPFTLD